MFCVISVVIEFDLFSLHSTKLLCDLIHAFCVSFGYFLYFFFLLCVLLKVVSCFYVFVCVFRVSVCMCLCSVY